MLSMEDRIAQDAGIVDHAVELAKAIDRHLDNSAGWNGFGDSFKVRHRRPAALLDFLDHFLGRRRTGSRAIGGAAGIVDHDLCPLGRAEQRDLTADAAPGAGDDDGFSVE